MKTVYNAVQIGDKKLSLFISAYILSSSLNMAVKTIFSVPQSMWSLISFAFALIIAISLIVAMPIILSRALNRFVLSEFVFLLLFAYSFFLGEAKQSILINTAFWTFVVCIPIGVSGSAVCDKQILFSILKKTAYIEYPILCTALLSLKSEGTYSMSVSYALILPILILLFEFFKFKKKWSLIFALFGTVLIMVFGARGPLLCIAIYIFIKIVFSRDISFLKQIAFFFLVACVVTILVFNWEIVLRRIEMILSANGISSYTLRRLINGELFETAGRNELWNYYIDLVMQHPIRGYGVLGGWISTADSPHNMLLEFVLAFGVFFGSIISLFSIILFFKSIRTTSEIHSEIALILASYNFTMYFVSGGWLDKPLFFFFVYFSFFCKQDFVDRKK